MSSNQLVQRVAGNVRAEMARKAITQTALAQRIGRNQQFVSRRVSGAIPFSVDELEVVAAALDVSVADLLRESAA